MMLAAQDAAVITTIVTAAGGLMTALVGIFGWVIKQSITKSARDATVHRQLLITTINQLQSSNDLMRSQLTAAAEAHRAVVETERQLTVQMGAILSTIQRIERRILVLLARGISQASARDASVTEEDDDTRGPAH